MQAELDMWLARLRSFWTWWSETLVTVLPLSLQARLFLHRADIRLGKTGVEIDIIDGRDGRTLREDVPLEVIDESTWAELDTLLLDRRVRLILPAHETYELAVTLSTAAQRNLGSAIALQLPSMAPLEPAHLCWTWQTQAREKKTLRVLVTMARKARVESISQAFEAHGIATPPIWCGTKLGLTRLVPGKALRRSDKAAREHMFVLAALALLATIPVTSWAGAKLLRIANEGTLADLHTELAPIIAAERAAARTEALRRAMRPLERQPVLSALVNDLAGALPDAVYIQSMEVRGAGSVRISLAGALKSGTIKALAAKSRLLAIAPIDVPDDVPSVEFLATVR